MKNTVKVNNYTELLETEIEPGDLIKVSLCDCGCIAGIHEQDECDGRDVPDKITHVPVLDCGFLNMVYSDGASAQESCFAVIYLYNQQEYEQIISPSKFPPFEVYMA